MTVAPTPKAALAAYERACRTHTRKDWRLACHALAAALQIAQEAPRAVSACPPTPKPSPSLCAFLSERGIRDDGGELRALDAELWHREQPFRRHLVRDDGVSLETAAQMAFDAGYFPHVAAPQLDSVENMHPVTEQMLIDAIRRELAGAGSESTDEDFWASLEPEYERRAA